VTDEIHIQMPSTMVIEKVRLFNNIGQIVFESNSLDFSVTSLSSGALYAEIQTPEGTFHKKIIKN